MTPQTGGHPGNALTPHDILRRDVLRHARAAYHHAMERAPVDEAPENLKLAAAQAPEDQEDDDQDKAASGCVPGPTPLPRRTRQQKRVSCSRKARLRGLHPL